MIASENSTVIAQPLVSIIVPAFNAAATIAQSLETIRNQTFKNFETIIVDDGSTDSTAQIARNVCDGDSRFILIQQKNSGVSAARNTALERALGKFIAFLDADDLWLPEKLERQVELLASNPTVNFTYTNFYVWDGNRDLAIYYSPKKMPNGDVSAEIFRTTLFLPSTVLLKRELLGDCRFDPQFCGGEDWDLWMQLVERGLFAGGIAEPLARYRRWEGNATAKKIKMTESAVRVFEKNLRLTKRDDLRPSYQRTLNLMRGRLEILNALHDADSSPAKTAKALWRAWRLFPRRFQWLLCSILLKWPEMLGGGLFRKNMHRKLMGKFS